MMIFTGWRRRLLDPVGINDTEFYVPLEKIERFTSCYQPEDKGGRFNL
jgi:hypothetical protein